MVVQKWSQSLLEQKAMLLGWLPRFTYSSKKKKNQIASNPHFYPNLNVADDHVSTWNGIKVFHPREV